MKLESLLDLIYENPTEFHRDFDDWLRDNQGIFYQVARKARRMRATGRGHYGIATIWETIRWETDLKEADTTFKLNNNWKADVSLLLMLAYPTLDKFFATRERKSTELGCFRPGSWGVQQPLFRGDKDE